MQIVAVTDPLQRRLPAAGDGRDQASRATCAAVADALAGMPEVDYVVITAGRFDLLAEIVCEDDDHLLEVINERIRAIPGVRTTESFVYLKLAQADLHLGNPMSTRAPSPRHRRPSRRARASDHLWMHFTRHVAPTRPAAVPTIVRGEGTYICDDQGKRYLDGLSGLFVVQAGHGRAELAEAAAKQAERAGVLPAVVLRPPEGHRARRAAGRTTRPGDLNKVFFTTGGGEAVETAWKLAKQYFKLTGKPTKYKVICRDDRLPRHPAGRPVDHRPAGAQGAVRAAGPRRAQGAEHQLLPRAGAPATTPRRSAAGPPTGSSEAIQFEGPDTVAAVFLEPVQNAGGCFPPPPGYFQRVREICDQYDVLLVSDEVICAFGRLGDDVRAATTSATCRT